MFKKNKKSVNVEQSKEIETEKTNKDDLQKFLVKLNLSLVENGQIDMLNDVEGDLKRLENQLDDFVYHKPYKTKLDCSSILKLVDSNEKQNQNLKNQISQFKQELYQFKSC